MHKTLAIGLRLLYCDARGSRKPFVTHRANERELALGHAERPANPENKAVNLSGRMDICLHPNSTPAARLRPTLFGQIDCAHNPALCSS
jgi:hypothetical protein